MTDKEKLEKLVAYLIRRMYAHNQMADIGSTGEIFDEKIENAKYEECRDTLNFIDSMQEEPKFKIGQIITDPDDSTFTFHINRIEDGKYIESDDAWVLIKDADEEYQLVEEPVSEDWKEAYRNWVLNHNDGDTLYCIDAWKAAMDWQKEHNDMLVSEDLEGEVIKKVLYFSENFHKAPWAIDSTGAVAPIWYAKFGANWQVEQFEKNRLKHCNSITNEQAELEQGFIDQHLDKHQRMPTFLDAIEYGMRLQNEQIIKRLCNHANIDQMVEKFEDKYKPEKVLDTEYYRRGIFDTIKAIKED